MNNRVVLLFRLACVALCAACFAPPARAATLNVPAQYATIQAAVTAASAGDTVLVADGTYTGAGNFNINFSGKDLTVQSASGNPANCVIDCQRQGGGFILQSNQTRNSSIAGFTIKNGSNSGVSISSAQPTVVNCILSGNFSSAGGGMNGGIAKNCVFTGNSGGYSGGGIYNGSAVDCVFIGNTGRYGGAISSGGAVRCVFTGNAGFQGGGIFQGSATNCVFTGNSASGDSGSGIFMGGQGGGLYSGSATGCIFTGNTADFGGGLEGGNARNCVFTGNSARYAGGGIYGVALYFCSVSGNSAPTYGGVYSNSSVTNCIVWGNTSSGGGPNFSVSGTVTSSDIEGGSTGTGNISVDPKFVNQVTGNLHLIVGSPCINAGTLAVPTGFPFPSTDVDGGKRIIGIAPDMGAYEYGNVGIFGAISFDGIAPNAPAQIVTFQFRPVGGGAATVKTYLTTSDGAFYLYGAPDGKYTLWVKSPTCLAAIVPVTVTGGAVSGITATLEPGDANNDNACDATDFGIFVSAYNSSASVPGSGYDPSCDFNGDGNVDPTDFGLLVGSYNTQGAP